MEGGRIKVGVAQGLDGCKKSAISTPPRMPVLANLNEKFPAETVRRCVNEKLVFFRYRPEDRPETDTFTFIGGDECTFLTVDISERKCPVEAS